MTFYQELQLGAAESKLQIKDSKNIKERMYHTAVYLFKVIITILFCIAVITVFTTFFGEENRMAGVVIVLGVMLFRNVSFEIRTSQGVLSLFVILAILTFAPHLANLANTVSPFAALPIHLLSVAVIVMLGCHNLYTCNQFVVVLSYLLLYGYDVSGQLIGIFGGMGTSFSATCRWQSMFNSLGAMSMAVVVFGNLRDAVLYRIVDNIIGAVYGILFGLLFHKAAAYIFNKKKDAKAINA